MKKPTSSHDREDLRLEHMANAGAETTRLLEQADIRNIGPEMVAVILAQIIAARNATLAGKVLYALEMAIQKYPIVKIIGAGTLKVDGDAIVDRLEQQYPTPADFMNRDDAAPH